MDIRTVTVAFSVLVGLVAVVPWRVPWRGHGHNGEGGSCPLGFGSTDGSGERLPSPHGRRRPTGTGIHSASASADSPLMVYTNATVWIGDRVGEQADAFVVDATTGRFLHVGSRATGLAAAAAAATSLPPSAPAEVDLQGAHVVPGLIDTHVHIIPGGLSLSRLDLSAITAKRQFIGTVAAAVASSTRPGQWLVGGGWDESHWGGDMPRADWIDEVTLDTPAWLLRHDVHMGLANSAALRLAGVDASTPDPAGGSIVRGPDGQPTGLLTDSAMQLVADRMPPLTLEERRAAFEAAMRHALSKGITMLHDMGRIAFMEGEHAAWDDLEELYIPAANGGRLPLRIYSFVPLTTWRRLAERVKHLGTAHPSGMLFWGGVKEFSDGSLGSSTALFHEPYADQPDTSGTLTIELHHLRQLVAGAHAAGLQVAVHAIGDRAVDEVAAIYAEVAANDTRSGSSSSSNSKGGSSSGAGVEDASASAGSDGGGSSSGEQQGREEGQQQQQRQQRHRIEHAQHLSGPEAARRMAAAGVYVTPNPLHLLADAAILEARLGDERAGPGRTYAFRTLQEAGVTAAFGSDWPVVKLEPLGTIYAAVHRRAPPDGRSSDHSATAAHAPQEALTVAEALWAHTQAGAEVAGLQQHLGSIRPGLLADFAVLSAAPGTAAAHVQQTYVNGQCVFGCDDGDGVESA